MLSFILNMIDVYANYDELGDEGRLTDSEIIQAFGVNNIYLM